MSKIYVYISRVYIEKDTYNQLHMQVKIMNMYNNPYLDILVKI